MVTNEVIVIAVLIVIIVVLVWGVESSDNNAPSAYGERIYIENLTNKFRTVTLHWVQWCGYCKIMMPIWLKIKSEVPPRFVMHEVNGDEYPTPGINFFPTIVMIDEYGKRHQYKGPADYKRLVNWLLIPVN